MLSLVTPIYNEQLIVNRLHEEVSRIFESIGLPWEVIYVDDGSRDDSLAMLLEFQRRDPHVVVAELSRNWGHQPAVTAGLSIARGDAIILMDGDLQDPPAVIPELVEAWKRGAEVVVADVIAEQAESVTAEITNAGGFATAVTVDVSDEAEVNAMVETAVDVYGGLHVMFNNAGIFPDDDGGVLDTPPDTWQKVMEVNLKGVWLGCRAAVPAMLDSGGGSIINVASFVALMGAATAQIAYTASKGGVLAMTRELAVEYARQGIRANSLCPGPIETPLLAELLADPERRQRRLVHIPIGRFGRPEEIAKAALFLASDDASFITGSALVVDGGITAAYVTPE